MTQEQVMIAVVEECAKRGVPASYEYPGFIQLSMRDGRFFNIGTASGETWGWDHDDNGESIESGDWSIPTSSGDIAAITNEIVILYTEAIAVCE